MELHHKNINSSGSERIVPTLLSMFFTFAKIGLFTFGGGYAMISLIEHACVEQKHWISHDEMMNMTVIAESTPGPIAINCSTYVGYKQRRLPGAVISTLGLVLPSFLIIYLISLFLDNLLEIRWVAAGFRGIKIAVGILILDAGIKMVKKMKKKPLPLTILLISCIVMFFINVFSWKFSSIGLILIAGVVGFLLSFVPESFHLFQARNRKEEERK